MVYVIIVLIIKKILNNKEEYNKNCENNRNFIYARVIFIVQFFVFSVGINHYNGKNQDK